ncbi:MAG: ATP-binding cassette domain-containing protein [Cyclobacteriaceae bacterium]
MIRLKNISYGYSRFTYLFKNMDFEIGEGNIVGLLGRNGAGKSTLLRLINGLLQARQGTVEVLGFDPFERSPNFLEEVIMIPEEHNLPDKTVMQHYADSLAIFYPRFDKERLKSLLVDFDLNATKKLGKCSYGQRKKFLIAFALSSGCKLLLLDEPTNGLDIPSKSLFRKMVAGNLQANQTVVISTHQVKDVENLIDRVILVDHGKVMIDQDMIAISDRYVFGFSTQQEEHWVYSEKALGGYHYVKLKEHGENASQVNLELFFNAVSHDKITFQATKNEIVL